MPPSYAVVIGAEALPPPAPPPIPRCSDAEPSSPTNSKPPPYSEAIQADRCDVSEEASPPLRAILNRIGESSSDPQNTSSNYDEPTNSETPQVVPVSMLAWHEDVKMMNEQTRQASAETASSPNNSQTVLTTGTIYLSNIINCTFGRGQRRHNAEINDSLQTTLTNPTTIRDRPAIPQLNNQDTITPFRLNANTL